MVVTMVIHLLQTLTQKLTFVKFQLMEATGKMVIGLKQNQWKLNANMILLKLVKKICIYYIMKN